MEGYVCVDSKILTAIDVNSSVDSQRGVNVPRERQQDCFG